MPHDHPLRMPLPVAVDGRVEDPPEQCGLLDDAARAPRLLADLRLEALELRRQAVLEEAGEVVRPAQPLDAADEPGRVAHRQDDVHREPLREPLGREQRDRVLHERPRARGGARANERQSRGGAQRLRRRPQREELRPERVVEVERAAEARAVALGVLGVTRV